MVGSISVAARGRRASRIGLVFVALALIAGGIASVQQPGHALGRERRIGYGTSVWGGTGNPCGSGEHPGVTREGEAIAGLNGLGIKTTFTMRTRYVPVVATVLEALWRHGGSASQACSAAWSARNGSATPAEALYFMSCAIGTPNRPALFCDAVNRIPQASRVGALRSMSTSDEIGNINVDKLCSNDPSNGGTSPQGTYKYVGWEGIGAQVMKFGPINVKLHHINFIAGAEGRLRDGPDDRERSYGRALNANHANMRAFFLLGNVDEWNRLYPGERWNRDDVFRNPVPFLVRWLSSGRSLFGVKMLDALHAFNNNLCGQGAWIKDLVDPGYGASRVAIDQTWRDLSTLMDDKALPRDTICERDPAGCKPTNFYDVWDAIYNGALPPANFPAKCTKRHGIKTVEHTFGSRGGVCNLGNLRG